MYGPLYVNKKEIDSKKNKTKQKKKNLEIILSLIEQVVYQFGRASTYEFDLED